MPARDADVAAKEPTEGGDEADEDDEEEDDEDSAEEQDGERDDREDDEEAGEEGGEDDDEEVDAGSAIGPQPITDKLSNVVETIPATHLPFE